MDSDVAWKIMRTGNSPFVLFITFIDLVACVVLWIKTQISVGYLVFLMLSYCSVPCVLVVEALDLPLLPLLALLPVVIGYGLALLRFYMTGSISSAFKQDFLISVKYGVFSLNAFIGYANSVIFFLTVAKLVQIVHTRLFEIPLFVPGLPPHQRLPRIVHLRHRKWIVDDFWFGTPARSRWVALCNVVLTLAVLASFFAYEIPRL
eukprot:TRINITY_DN402_c0_g2_i1.p1 TRINITY_DN402_c0_g2~~TRINITY_DN402_c0_g2_i1.p1  ORF type:complete len:205 (+),score=52.30 TRINITY_DN402_c0_g2_i1:587-1201(+)